MGKVARQVVEQAGIDVNVLIDKLVRAASGARGLVLGVFERRPVGTFPARRAWLFALREPLPDSGLQAICRSTKRAGWTRFNRPHGRQVLVLAHWAGWLFALEGFCPHRENPLEGAVLWDHLLDCPWHHFHYDIRTGRTISLKTFTRKIMRSSKSS